MADGPTDLGSEATKFWPIIAGIAVAGWALLRQFLSGRQSADREKAAAILQKGELINIAQAAAKDVIRMLTEENSRLSNRVDALDDEVKKLQDLHAETLRSKDAEILLMRGDLRQALSVAAAYELLLTKNNIPHEQLRKPYWELMDNEVRPEPPKGLPR